MQVVLDEMATTPGGTAVDLGTGSGAIALSLAEEGRFDRVIADGHQHRRAGRRPRERRAPSAEGRAPAVGTPRRLTGSPRSRESVARVIVANPPYIAPEEASSLPASVRDWEPPTALFAGDTGMKETAYIIRGAPRVLEPGGLLALEVDSRRASLAAELALADGRYRNVAVRLDLTGRERILVARRGE